MMPRLEGTWDRYLDPDATRARLLKLMAESEARASRSVIILGMIILELRSL